MRLIDADALLEKLDELWDTYMRRADNDDNNGFSVIPFIMGLSQGEVEVAPTIDAVRHARWVGKYKSTCSGCGDVNIRAFAGPVPMYCQVCGACMDEEGNNG